MTIYLYVKTHTITGLKYLGKTIKKDPHKYKGSGVHWLRHLKVHGATYTTEILRECQTDDEVTTWGLHYSELWNVAGSDEWANLMPETGTGVRPTPEIIARAVATRRANDSYRCTPEIIAKQLATREANGTFNTRTPENIAKAMETKRANGNLKQSPETIAKIVATKRANGCYEYNAETVAKRRATMEANGGYPPTPEAIEKMLATKRARGTDKRRPETIAKQKATRARNKARVAQDTNS